MRVDRGALESLIRLLEEKPGIRKQLLYGWNSSLELRGGLYRYHERKQTASGRVHTLTAVGPSPVVTKALELSRNGVTAPALAQQLAGQMPLSGAKALVSELIEAKLLTSELEQTVTGEDAYEWIHKRVDVLKGARAEKLLFRQLGKLLKGTKTPFSSCLKVVEKLEGYLNGQENSAVRTDIVYQGEFKLSSKWVNVLAKEFEMVMPLLEVRRDEEFVRFRNAFRDRFEGREVPLTEALDSVDGIGYADARPGLCEHLPLLEDLSFPGNPQELSYQEATGRLKENLVERALLENSQVVKLTEGDLKGIGTAGGPGSEGLYWLGSFLARSAGDLDRGDFLFLARSIGGPSGLELLGRFCQSDPALGRYVQQAAAEFEAQSRDVIYAEIAHLPDPRLGNVLQRPHLSTYEIVYLCGSKLPVENRIYLSDLMVSVKGNQVVLRSKRLGKRVIPRLTTAHNFTTGLPVYRFLCDVAGQGTVYNWHWGHLSTRTFLPRVQYGHWILSRARWMIHKDRFPMLFDESLDFEAEWNKIRNKLAIPGLVQIADGDRELLIDSRCSRSLEELRRHLGREEMIRLVEFPLEVTGFLDGYVNEVVLPVRNGYKPVGYHDRFASAADCPEPPRGFPPCSEWTYVKVYCGPQTADALLADRIGPLLNGLSGNGKIEKWFFVRYADPDPHLRIRYKSGQGCLLAKELGLLFESGQLQRIQYDTYSRELERYTGLDYETTESVFHADSEAVIELLRSMDSADERWLAGLVGADRLMNDLGMDLDLKTALVEDSFGRLFKEVEGGTSLKVQLDAKYRGDRKLIEACLDEKSRAWQQAFRRRSRALETYLKAKRHLIRVEVAASYVHMFFNRLLISQPRNQEMILYYYMKKYYHSIRKQYTRPCN